MDISLLFALILWAEDKAEQAKGGSSIFSSPLIPMLGVIILFWFLLVLPQQRRAKREQEARLKALKKNDKVVLQGGIIGVISSIKEDSDEVVVKLEEGKIRVLKSSILGPRTEPDKTEGKDTATAAQAAKDQSKDQTQEEGTSTAIQK